MIPCACGVEGCMIEEGKTTGGAIRRYKKGHYFRGVKGVSHPAYGNHHSFDGKKSIGLAASIRNRGERHGGWKGDSVGVRSLHLWIRKHLDRPKLCVECNSSPSFEVANISPVFNPETYNRDLSNWRWVCRKCHFNSDNRPSQISEATKGKPTWNKGKKWEFMSVYRKSHPVRKNSETGRFAI